MEVPRPTQQYAPVQMATKNESRYPPQEQTFYPGQGGLRYPEPDEYAGSRVLGGRTSIAY